MPRELEKQVAGGRSLRCPPRGQNGRRHRGGGSTPQCFLGFPVGLSRSWHDGQRQLWQPAPAFTRHRSHRQTNWQTLPAWAGNRERRRPGADDIAHAMFPCRRRLHDGDRLPGQQDMVRFTRGPVQNVFQGWGMVVFGTGRHQGIGLGDPGQDTVNGCRFGRDVLVMERYLGQLAISRRTSVGRFARAARNRPRLVDALRRLPAMRSSLMAVAKSAPSKKWFRCRASMLRRQCR